MTHKNTKYNGAKYYSNDDWSIGENLRKAESVIKKFFNGCKFESANEILELYNVSQLINSGVKLIEWNDKYYSELVEASKSFNGIIGKFFSLLNDENILLHIDELDNRYIDDFFYLLDNYKSYNNISEKSINELLENKKIKVTMILSNKQLSAHYKNSIKEYLLNNSNTAPLILSYYLEDNNKQLYFPDNFSGDDKENVINSYLDSNDVNPNYLKLIIDSNPSKQLPFSDKTKLKAKRLYNKFAEEVFSDESKGHKYGVEVIFDEKLDDVMKTEYIDSVYRITYGTNYLKESLDYPSLLNNFIYLFEYTDLQFRSNWYLRKSNLGIFESILGIRGKAVYNVGVSFNLLNMLSLSQISIYSAFLNRNNIVIENVIKWFFEEYLKEEFSVNNYCFNVPSQNISFSEKCKLLLIELESILKQFKCFVEEGEIVRELLEISSKHLKFESIPSMIKDKYLYLNEKAASNLTYFLFSNQCGLSYTDRFQDKYENFAKLLFNESININDFDNVQKSRIKILDSASIIKINENGNITYDKNKILLLQDLYNNEVSRKSYVYKRLSCFSNEEIENYFQFGSTLFSKPEQAYLNYMLNNAEFSNSLALRNKYLHGTAPNNDEENERDYYQILKIIVFIVIKINEEFCAKNGNIYD